MAEATLPGVRTHFTLRSQLLLGWAFVERQKNLWKRHWMWELVWLFYGAVNTLAITFIAKELTDAGVVTGSEANDLLLFLLIGTLVWAYLSAVLDDISLVITWERWEGTIEHTLMAPVPRVAQLVGTAAFGVLHAIVRTSLIMAMTLPFFEIDLGGASWSTVVVVMAIGSVSLVGLGILAGILPMLYPERGEQLSFMTQAMVLLVSGVYYSVETLPGWLQAVSTISPATYLLRGTREAIIDGASVGDLGSELFALAVFAVVLLPASIAIFKAAERYAKRTGKLKRQG